ncbi:MAG: PAS domain S-box protein [Methanoregulaceae archaeon]|nr:PAS domain S-box protein [Methanoregulaceae archaeon]
MADRILVLCVDDEPDLLEMDQLFLERSGEFSIDPVLSAPEALERLNKKNYDAIVSDYQMPEMDGIELLKRVRADDKNVPSIIMTGRGREEVVIQALNLGANFYLQKGGDPKILCGELMHVIRQAVRMRRTQITIAEQEQRYHDLQNANDLIQSVAPDGRFLFVNKKWLDTLGYQEHELANLTIFDIIHEESLAHCRETFQRVISGENVGIIDAVFRTRDGTRVYVEGMATCKMVDGRPQYTRGIFKDVTRRKEVERGLFESENKFATVFKSNPVSLTLVSARDGVFADVNDAFLRNTGYTRTEVIGKTAEELGIFADETEYARFAQELQKKRSVHGMELRCRIKTGEIRFCRFSSSVVITGNTPHILSTVEDITDQKAAESAIHTLVTGMVGTTGTESLDRISESISAWLGADCVMVGEITPDQAHVQVLSMILDGKKITEYSYTLKGTPCENTAEKGFCMYHDNVTNLFPESRDLSELNIRGYIGTALRNSKGQVIGVLCILTRKPLDLPPSVQEIIDIIAAKAAAEIGRLNALKALSESEEKFRTIFENSPYPIAINSFPDNKFLEINSAFLKASGYAEAEVRGKDPIEMGLISHIDAVRLIMKRVMEGKIENVPLALTVKGGKRVHVLFSTMGIKIKDRPAIMTVTAETTSLKRIEEELLRKNEELTAADEELRKNLEELRRKEQELSASESRYRTLFENMLDGFAYCKMVYDESGRPDDFIYIETNKAFSQLTGLGNVCGKRVTEVIPGIKEMNPEIFETYGRVARTGTPEAVEVYFKPLEKWLNISVYSPEKECFVAVFEDFTDRKNAEEALRESEEKLQLALSGSDTGMWELDIPTMGGAIDDRAAQILGYRKQDIGSSVTDWNALSHPDDVPLILKRLADYLEGRTPSFESEHRMRHASGEWIWMAGKGKITHRLLDGSPLRISGTLQDITQRKLAEDALRKSEEMLALVMNGVPTLIAYLDTDLRFVYINKPHAEWLGRSEDELIGKSLHDLLPEDVFSRAAPYYEKVLSGQVVVFENQTRDQEGTEHVMAVRLVPHIREGRVVGFFAALNDITERRQAEEALCQANKKLSLLSSITRHDINNRLLVLNSYVELLHLQNPDPTLESHFSRITMASDQIANMIRFTKEYEQVGVQLPVWQNLKTLIDDAGKSATLGQVSLINDVSANVEVFADPLITKVFFNLVDNALRHGGRITTIRFAHEDRDGDLVIVCEDNGDGIASELKEKIFARGFGKNTGFGLSISREILDITGITIKETGKPGSGARFEITVPAGQYRLLLQ